MKKKKCGACWLWDLGWNSETISNSACMHIWYMQEQLNSENTGSHFFFFISLWVRTMCACGLNISSKNACMCVRVFAPRKKINSISFWPLSTEQLCKQFNGDDGSVGYAENTAIQCLSMYLKQRSNSRRKKRARRGDRPKLYRNTATNLFRCSLFFLVHAQAKKIKCKQIHSTSFVENAAQTMHTFEHVRQCIRSITPGVDGIWLESNVFGRSAMRSPM